MIRCALLILFGLITAFSQAGDTSGLAWLKNKEQKLSAIAPLIITAENDNLRNNAGLTLFSGLEDALRSPAAADYPFDSLKTKTVSVLESPDRNFRIFTFNVILTNGRYQHYGLLHVKDGSSWQVFSMQDTSLQAAEDVIKKELDPEKWYGALYYEIVPFRVKKENMYLLLGYDGADIHSNRKVIDVLWFDHGEPVFGKEIFSEGSWKSKLNYRAVFEFHNDSRMLMRYEPKQNIIMIDKLAPAFPEAVNNPYYYIPSGDYDCYAFSKSIWTRSPIEKLKFGEKKEPKKSKKQKNLPTPEKDPLNPDNLPEKE